MALYCPQCQNTISAEDSNRCGDCGRNRPPRGWPRDPLLHTEVAGRQYQVIRRLGAGGFGVVYEVETAVGRLRRALKVLKEGWNGNETFRRRFINEALVLERINHPYVARCLSAGTLDESGEPYLLFELILGVGLGELLKSGANQEPAGLEPLRAVRLAKQIASGLVAAHAVNVLHRDLKPGNIIIVDPGTPNERVKLLDFGISKLIESESTSLGGFVGTPIYMAPEQFNVAMEPDVRLDLWQLGATLFTMLTGRPPYESADGTWQGLLGRHRPVGEPGPEPSALAPDLADHPALDQLVSRLLSTSPEDRPASATEVCGELARIEQALLPASNSARPALLDVLCANPSRTSWAALCRFLESQDNQFLEAAEERLRHWSDSLRRAPLRWWEETRSGRGHSLWPLARTLDLSHRGLSDEEMARLAASPAISGLRGLNLRGNPIGPAGAAALAASRFLLSLESLDLTGTRIGSEGLSHLCRSRSLGNLRELRLGDSSVGAPGVKDWAQTESRLRKLDLSGNRLGPEEAEILAKSRSDKLEILRLSNNLLGPDGVSILAVSPLLGRLREIDLGGNGIGPSGAASLALSGNSRHLRTLVLARNHLGRQGLELLLVSSSFEALEWLDLSSNGIGPNGTMVLASSALARRLRFLDLRDNGIGDAGFAALLGSPQLMGLGGLGVANNNITPAGIAMLDGAALQVKELDLSDNLVTREGAAGLKKAVSHLGVRRLFINRVGLTGSELAGIVEGGAGCLEALEVSDNVLDAEATNQLARVSCLRRLESLALNHVWDSPETLAALIASPFLENLRRLSLGGNALGDGGVARLAAASGLVRMDSLDLSDNGIGHEGASSLARSALAARLRELDLSFNQLGDAGLELLLREGTWHRLEELRIRANDIGYGGAAVLTTASGVDMLQVVDLGENPLIGLTDIQGLPRDQIDLMERSFAVVSEVRHSFSERFYEQLFDRYPGLKPLFENVSMKRQQEHLFSSLVMIIENLRRPDTLQNALTALGERHVGYGVRPSHYYMVSSTLLESIRESAGAHWSPELENAWAEGIEAVSRVMMVAHRGKRRSQSMTTRNDPVPRGTAESQAPTLRGSSSEEWDPPTRMPRR